MERTTLSERLPNTIRCSLAMVSPAESSLA